MSKTDGVSFAILFGFLFLLAPPLLTESKIFDTEQLTRQIKLEVKVAQVTQHPLLTRGALDYLQENQDNLLEDEENAVSCKDTPAVISEDKLAEIATEIAKASQEQKQELKDKYYCYSFEILSYYIAKHQNKYLQDTLDIGFDEELINSQNAGNYNISHLFNQAVLAENKEALALLAEKDGQYLYSALENFIDKNSKATNLEQETSKYSFKYKHRQADVDNLVYAVLHNSRYELAAAKKYIPRNLRRAKYFKALNTLIDIRISAK